ncbi:MAG: 2-C-methyl-D-erythritol 2,4-cyclodiphosphate synthase [Gammaproteobacteria bacterium]|nr:2-C-methyl-D-erythritol 2,4-cyclodiphosphate synthase [Gammaproteobacteria bacterium]
MSLSQLRIGHGFDVHRFSEQYSAEKPLRLAGVTLPDKLSLLAHSDGDVVLHAVCDAILGSVGEGDIGTHFPDTDAAWANADSVNLLRQVLTLARNKGVAPSNVDITVVSQIPKLAPHRQALVARLADLLNLQSDQVNLKATTTEGLGYTGRKEGIACHCVVLMAPFA